MLYPQYVHKKKLHEAIQRGSQDRTVPLGISKPQMLPNSVHQLLQMIQKKSSYNEIDWLTWATCAECWCGYHHLCTRILPAQWADAPLLFFCVVASAPKEPRGQFSPSILFEKQRETIDSRHKTHPN